MWYGEQCPSKQVREGQTVRWRQSSMESEGVQSFVFKGQGSRARGGVLREGAERV